MGRKRLTTVEATSQANDSVAPPRAGPSERNLAGRPDAEGSSACLANFAHRLSQPVTALLGTLQLALLTAKNLADYRSAVQEAVELAEQMARLVRLFRELASPGNDPGDEESVTLGKMIREAGEELRPMAESLGVRVTFGGLDEQHVRACAKRLREAVVKILFNAIHRTPQGGTVRAALTSLDGEAHLTITDEGESLGADEMNAIPNPFAASLPRPQKLEETHLEWAIAAQTIQRMRGSLSLTGAVPKGCCCRIQLPLVPGGHPPSDSA